MKANTLLMALLVAISINYLQAQPATKEDTVNTSVRLIRYDVKPASLKAFKQTVTNYILHSLTLESNVLSEAYYEEQNTAVIWIIERWRSKKAMNEAGESLLFKAIPSLQGSVLITPPTTFYVKDLEPLSKTDWRKKPAIADTPMTIMLFVDCKSGTEEQFKKVYHAAMPQFRSEPGVINYQLSQFMDDNTKFVTYEKFRGESAFQYHLAFPPIQPVIDYLNTSIKKQPFQTGLHRLIAFAYYNH